MTPETLIEIAKKELGTLKDSDLARTLDLPRQRVHEYKRLIHQIPDKIALSLTKIAKLDARHVLPSLRAAYSQGEIRQIWLEIAEHYASTTDDG